MFPIKPPSVQMSEKEQEVLRETLWSQRELFSIAPTEQRTMDFFKHAIDTGDSRPIAVPPRRLPHYKSVWVDKHLAKLLRQGTIRVSKSPWAAPIHLAPKKEEEYRFCVDYKRLNSVTKRDMYPLPRMDNVLANLQGATVFSALDLASGFYHIEVEEGDKEKLAFRSEHGLFEFNVLPFGVSNGPSTFQRAMDYVLRDHIGKICYVYLDDIIIYSKSVQEHLAHLATIMSCLRQNGLYLKGEKCVLLQNKINYLGKTVSKDGLSMTNERVSAIRDMVIPTSKEQLAHFLHVSGYYRHFVPLYAETTYSLRQAVLPAAAPWAWTEEMDKAFSKVKEILTREEEGVLHHPDFDQDFIILTDACKLGLGAVLAQRRLVTLPSGNKVWKEVPICYLSRAITPAETAYDTTELEALGVIWALETFEYYTVGRKITIITDHAALRWLLNNSGTVGGRIHRWAYRLNKFDFEIIHRAGRTNGAADGLSRYMMQSVKHITKEMLIDATWIYDQEELAPAVLRATSTAMVIGTASEPEQSGQVRDTVQADKGTPSSFLANRIKLPDNLKIWLTKQSDSNNDVTMQEVAKLQSMQLVRFADQKDAPDNQHRAQRIMKDEYGLLRYTYAPKAQRMPGETDEQAQARRPSVARELLIVPSSLREQTMRELHELTGHRGFRNAVKIGLLKYWWPTMYDDIKTHCLSCLQCQRHRYKLKRTHPGPYRPITAIQRNEVWVIDIWKPTVPSEEGYTCLLVIMDVLTRRLWLMPLFDEKSASIANELEIAATEGGTPKLLQSDNQSSFTDKGFKVALKELDIKIRFSPAHTPQSQGIVESKNRFIRSAMAINLDELGKTRWSRLSIKRIQQNLNATPTRALGGRCPDEMTWGERLRTPEDVRYPFASEPSSIYMLDNEGPSDYMRRLSNVLRTVRDEGRQYRSSYNQKNQQSTKYVQQYFDPEDIQINDLVFEYNFDRRQGSLSKMEGWWLGPFRVSQKPRLKGEGNLGEYVLQIHDPTHRKHKFRQVRAGNVVKALVRDEEAHLVPPPLHPTITFERTADGNEIRRVEVGGEVSIHYLPKIAQLPPLLSAAELAAEDARIVQYKEDRKAQKLTEARSLEGGLLLEQSPIPQQAREEANEGPSDVKGASMADVAHQGADVLAAAAPAQEKKGVGVEEPASDADMEHKDASHQHGAPANIVPKLTIGKSPMTEFRHLKIDKYVLITVELEDGGLDLRVGKITEVFSNDQSFNIHIYDRDGYGWRWTPVYETTNNSITTTPTSSTRPLILQCYLAEVKCKKCFDIKKQCPSDTSNAPEHIEKLFDELSAAIDAYNDAIKDGSAPKSATALAIVVHVHGARGHFNMPAIAAQAPLAPTTVMVGKFAVVVCPVDEKTTGVGIVRIEKVYNNNTFLGHYYTNTFCVDGNNDLGQEVIGQQWFPLYEEDNGGGLHSIFRKHEHATSKQCSEIMHVKQIRGSKRNPCCTMEPHIEDEEQCKTATKSNLPLSALRIFTRQLAHFNKTPHVDSDGLEDEMTDGTTGARGAASADSVQSTTISSSVSGSIAPAQKKREVREASDDDKVGNTGQTKRARTTIVIG